MTNTTIVITSFLRPWKLKKSVESARRFNPDTPIIVVDCSRKEGLEVDWWRNFVMPVRETGAVIIELPFDAGISAMRNEGVKQAGTPYVLICEDDIYFTEESSVAQLEAVLKVDPSVGFAAGSLEYPDGRRAFGCRIVEEPEKQRYREVEIKEPTMLEASVDGLRVAYFHAEYVYNFGLLRTAMPVRWDPDFKTSAEHIFFSMSAKAAGWKFAVVPAFCGMHDKTAESDEFISYRKRHSGWQKFAEKTGFRYGIGEGASLVYDLVEKKVLTYPEYAYKLLSKQIPGQSGASIATAP